MNKLLYLAMVGLILCAARAQMPDLGQGKEIWRGQLHAAELRLVQIPGNATALIPLRFVLEETGRGREAHACEFCAIHGITDQEQQRLLTLFDGVQIRAVAGAEATLAYRPKTSPLFFWGENLAEARETFRAPGEYALDFFSEAGRDLNVQVRITVQPVQYLGFLEEFGLFATGCLLLGSLMAALIVWLHRRAGNERSGLAIGIPPQSGPSPP